MQARFANKRTAGVCQAVRPLVTIVLYLVFIIRYLPVCGSTPSPPVIRAYKFFILLISHFTLDFTFLLILPQVLFWYRWLDTYPTGKQLTGKQLIKMGVLVLVESIKQSLHAIINEEFQCPICQDHCKETFVNPDCGHRFCTGCIKESI